MKTGEIRTSKNGVVLLTLLVAAAMLMTGCGKDAEAIAPPEKIALQTEDTEQEQTEEETKAEDDTASETETSEEDMSSDEEKEERLEEQVKESQPQSETDTQELEGNVRDIGTDSFTVIKQQVWSEGDAMYAAAPAPGYEEEEDLCTVRVADTAVYRYKTVKNSGINPEDITEREGSYADLEEGLSVTMQGSWQDDVFYAEHIDMMKVL